MPNQMPMVDHSNCQAEKCDEHIGLALLACPTRFLTRKLFIKCQIPIRLCVLPVAYVLRLAP